MAEYDLPKLQEFLNDHRIAEAPKRELTFLDISRQTTKENVWSSIYAFFFHAEGEHGLGDLFQRSLIDLINESRNEKDEFETLTDIQREYPTINRGRIDILLKNDDQAIIIENKVFHHEGGNDFDDYWKSVEQPYKRGVILCLRKASVSAKKGQFVYITHNELLKRVESNYPSDFEKSNPKMYLFLIDFMMNVANVTNSMNPELLKFCFDNQKKIHDTIQLNNEYKNYIIKEIETAPDIFNQGQSEQLNLAKAQNDRYRYYECPENAHLSLTIIFDGLFNGNNDFAFVVELKYDLLEKARQLNHSMFEESSRKFLQTKFYGKKDRWQHYSSELITVSNDQIKNLSEFIAQSLEGSESFKIYKVIKNALIIQKVGTTSNS